MFAFGRAQVRRKPALTPLIDVVFLLLVFFMLAAQFGREGALELTGGSGETTAYDGAPRLVTVLPDGILLNGVPIGEDALPDALSALMTERSSLVVLRSGDGTTVQRLTDLAQALADAGFGQLVLVE